MDQWQQGHVSRQEVSGEAKATNSDAVNQPTTPRTANPNYRIPKKSSFVSNNLNKLALNISPTARERKKETDEQYYKPPKQKHKH